MYKSKGPGEEANQVCGKVPLRPGGLCLHLLVEDEDDHFFSEGQHII